jgi:DNA-binding MarR family transcriptional regulator
MSPPPSAHAAPARSFAKQAIRNGEPIGLLVAAVRRRLKQAVATLVREHRLSPQQFWTVVAIAREPGLSLGELALRRRMDEPTACRVVETLVRRGLVRKAPDPGDQRRLCLALTPAGAGLARTLLPLASAIGAAVEAGLSRAEREAVVSGLRKVLSNLDRFTATTLAERVTSPRAGKGEHHESRRTDHRTTPGAGCRPDTRPPGHGS